MSERPRPLIVGENALVPRNGLLAFHLLRMIPRGDSIPSQVGRGLILTGMEISRSIVEASQSDKPQEPPVRLCQQ